MIDPALPDYLDTPVAPGRPRFAFAGASEGLLPRIRVVTVLGPDGWMIHETAQSLLRQSLPSWEWVIVEQGNGVSRTRELALDLGALDSRIVVIAGDRGPTRAAARNQGARGARADLLCWLDAGDLLEPTCLEKWMWFLFAYTDRPMVSSWWVRFGARNGLEKHGFEDGARALDENLFSPALLIRRAVFEDVGGFDPSIEPANEMRDLLLRCATAGHWGITLPEYLCWHREMPWRSAGDAARCGVGDRLFAARVSAVDDGCFRVNWPDPPRLLETLPEDRPVMTPPPNRPSRILVIVPFLFVGGSEKAMLDIVGELCGRGWEVTVAATDDADHVWIAPFASLTPDVFVLPHLFDPLARSTDEPVEYPRFLRHLAASRGADVVLVSNSALGYGVLPCLRAELPSSAFVIVRHTSYWPLSTAKWGGCVDLTIVSSEAVRRRLLELGEEPERVETYYTGIDAERWRPDPERRAAIRRELGIDPAIPLVVYASRLSPDKQPEVFARTMRELDDRGIDFAAIVTGDGPLRTWLAEFVVSHGLGDRVRLLGVVEIDRLPALMAAADISFLPSLREGIAVTAFESMACGLVFVGADVGGQRELVTPDCGILIPPLDVASDTALYAEALAALLTDAARRERMGERARERVRERFRLEQMGDRIESLLRAAIDRARRSPPAALDSRVADAMAAVAVRHAFWERYASNASRWGRSLEELCRTQQREIERLRAERNPPDRG